MKWISKFQLFLFDFDGLLVNTEHLHYQAYVKMLSRRGYHLPWSFLDFCAHAHLNATALKEGLYREIPDLEPNWSLLYNEKKEAYRDLLLSGQVELMGGVEQLLQEIQRQGVARCVVTNSPLEQIELIRNQLPILTTIPHWITREDYSQPKPSPECYLRAISLYAQEGANVIGFEDSVRGFEALSCTPALPVLVCPPSHPLLPSRPAGRGVYVESLSALLNDSFPN